VASQASRRYRQLLPRALFLAAIIAPCIVLVTLSLRLIAQDRELAGKRAQDNRRLAVVEIAQRLTRRLDQLRLQALAAGPAFNHGGHAIALVAPVRSDRLMLPWDDTAAQLRYRTEISSPQFASAMADAERVEYLIGNRVEAHAGYQAALGRARSPEQRAAASLAVLRTASTEVLARGAPSLLQSTVVDEEGVPVSLYAARVLLARGAPSADAHEIIGVLRNALDRAPPLNLVGLHMVGSLTEAPHLNGAGIAGPISALRADAAARLAAAQQAHDLQAAFPGIAARHDGIEAGWMPFGPDDDMWLVTVARPPAAREAAVVAVRAGALEGAPALKRSPEPAFEALGSAYSGLFVRVPDQPVTGGESVRTVLLAIVVLTVAIALSGGWFFWRDVRRDLRLAELRSQFVASVSHELKTPLTAIRMFAETLRLGRTPPARTTEYLDTIVSESERLTRLLNNVLDFSKVEQGTRRYQLLLQPLAPILRSAARTLRYPLEQEAFELQVTIDDEELQARCDADALEQAILNLLSNAMKYSGTSRVIALRLTEADGGGVAISVSDRGIGIPAAEQPRIFEKFYRGAADAHQRVAGTGLGLTLVQHTVHAHGGTISVESSPEGGSTFTIRLPVVPASEPAPASVLSGVPHDAASVIES
jgi:signal transduction histidine kinase